MARDPIDVRGRHLLSDLHLAWGVIVSETITIHIAMSVGMIAVVTNAVTGESGRFHLDQPAVAEAEAEAVSHHSPGLLNAGVWGMIM